MTNTAKTPHLATAVLYGIRCPDPSQKRILPENFKISLRNASISRLIYEILLGSEQLHI